ncbi:hypothetical protein JCM10213v2_003130 [Rhodosporidiobolus nylandii]
MLDCLPVELLQHILRLAAPLDYSPELYKERRSTLRSCCLVNRTMRELAQPMLPEVFVVDREEEIQELEGDARGFRVKNLVFKRVKRGVVDFNTIAMDSVARLCPNIVDLKLFQPDAFDLEPVSSLPLDTGLQICATRGIEVAFPDNAQDWHHDSLVSPWFWRRMGRIKEEEGEQPGQAVGSG